MMKKTGTRIKTLISLARFLSNTWAFYYILTFTRLIIVKLCKNKVPVCPVTNILVKEINFNFLINVRHFYTYSRDHIITKLIIISLSYNYT